MSLPQGRPDATRDRPRLLCLSGGGYRGLFTATILARIEQRLAAKLNYKGEGSALLQYFNLVAGTSVGGLLACGLASGVKAAQMAAALRDNGHLIFPERRFKRLRQFLFETLYEPAPLQTVVETVLGESAQKTLADIEIPLLVPAVSWISGEVVLFQSAGLVGPQNAHAVTLLDVCLATSAAPTYFPAHTVRRDGRAADVMVDGGIAANAPELAAVSAACAKWSMPLSDIEVLSIGTASPSAGAMADSVPRGGVLSWASEGVKLVLNAQERYSVNLCINLLGPQNYVRIDQHPSKGQAALSAMDEVNASMTTTLVKLAEDALENAKATPLPAWVVPLLH